MPLVVTDWSVSPSDAVAPTPVDSTGRVLFARQGPDADSLKNIQQHKSDAIERRHKSSLKVWIHLACSGLTDAWNLVLPCTAAVALELQQDVPSWAGH